MGLEQRFFVRVGRAPSQRLDAVGRDDPWVEQVGQHRRRDLPHAETPAPRQQPPDHVQRQRRERAARKERPHVFGSEPAGRRHVEHSRVVTTDDERQRTHQVVDVHHLDWCALPADAQPTPAGQDACPQMFGARAHDRRRPQDRDRHVGMFELPLVEQTLDFGCVGRRTEPRVRAQRRILGQRHRIRRPGAVHRRGRHPDDGADSHRRRRVQQPPCPFDVRARHRAVVRDRIEHPREMHDRLDALDQRLDLAAGDVNEMVFETRCTALRITHVQAHDPLDAGPGERRHQPGSDESGRAGHGHRLHRSGERGFTGFGMGGRSRRHELP